MTTLAANRPWNFQARIELQFIRGENQYTDAAVMTRTFAGYLRETTGGAVSLAPVADNPYFNTIRTSLLGIDGEHTRASFTLTSAQTIDTAKVALAFAKCFQSAGHSGMSATRIASKTPNGGGCASVDTAATAPWNPFGVVFAVARGTVISQVCLNWSLLTTAENPAPESTLHDRSAASLGDASVGSSTKPSEIGTRPPGYGAGFGTIGVDFWGSIPLEAKIGGGVIVVVALMVGIGYSIRSVRGAVG